ncbi:hypothetical protein AALA24_07570 [Anaerovoracaceae bacterium 42-11]
MISVPPMEKLDFLRNGKFDRIAAKKEVTVNSKNRVTPKMTVIVSV